MLREGTRVAQLTKKVGQVARTGKVANVRGDTVVVKWDDGRESVVSRSSLAAIHKK